MNKEIIFKRDKKMIKDLLEDVFEKISKQKINDIIYYPNSTKIQRTENAFNINKDKDNKLTNLL